MEVTQALFAGHQTAGLSGVGRARYRWHSRSAVREIFDRLGADQAARRTIDEVARIIALIGAIGSAIDSVLRKVLGIGAEAASLAP